MSQISERGQGRCVTRIFVKCMDEMVIKYWSIRLGFVALEMSLVLAAMLCKYFSEEHVDTGPLLLVFFLLMCLIALCALYSILLGRMKQLNRVQLKIADTMKETRIGNIDLTNQYKLEDFVDPDDPQNLESEESKSELKRMYYEIIRHFQTSEVNPTHKKLSNAALVIDIIVFFMAVMLVAHFILDFPNAAQEVFLFLAVLIAFVRVIVQLWWTILEVCYCLAFMLCCQCCIHRNKDNSEGAYSEIGHYPAVLRRREENSTKITCSGCKRTLPTDRDVYFVACPQKHQFHRHCYEHLKFVNRSRRCPLCPNQP